MAEIKKTRILRIISFLLLIVLFCPFASGKVIYVDDDAAEASDGSSWIDAYPCLQNALAAARFGDEIQVAKGIYKPDQHFVKGRFSGVLASGDRTATFQLINGVIIKGGYASSGEPDPDARDVELYETILSGDLNGDDGPGFTNNAENSYRVVTGSGTDQTAVLDGFIITAGNANAHVRYRGGSGMLNSRSSPTLNNCTFSGNYSDIGGTISNSESSPILNNCTFTENVSDFGGSMYNTESSPTLTNCTFSGNSAGTSGGAIANVKWSSPTVTNCTFSSNSAGWGGGGMSNDTGCSPKLTNCTFSGNLAGGVGGGILNVEASNPTLINCTFSENSTEGRGGGVSNLFGSHPIITNCIVWGNTPQNNSQIDNNSESSIIITYSDVQGGWEGEGNIDVDPLFADADNGDYHLKSQAGRWDPNSESWVKDDVASPCIDMGDPNSDWSGETWPHGGRINIGAYGGTRQASMSLETEGMSLPRVAYIFSYVTEAAESFQFLLGAYGCSTTLINIDDVPAAPLDSYDLLIVANDTEDESIWSDPNTVAAIEDSGKPVVGLGDGGYDFFGLLGLSIGYPNGAHGSQNSIEVIDPNSSLFRTPYSIEIPEDRVLRLYTETDHVGLYLWPTIPETVTVLAEDAIDFPYYLLATEYNRYLIWGFTESPEKMTEIGKTLFINVVIHTANEAWESEI